MSGPVTYQDASPADTAPATDSGPTLDVLPSRNADVAGLGVRRALPRRSRRTVGPWCFADHFGPTLPSPGVAMRIGPHPHIGLQTVTWLLEGEALHTDSLGSEQLIRPGQLNLMTAGRGVAHAEESPLSSSMHGVQLWVAQPEATRNGAADFEHHAELPDVDLGAFHLTVMIGGVAGVTSPARAETPMVGVDVASDGGRTIVPLERGFEHAIIVVAGAVEIHGEIIQPGSLAYLGTGREELPISVAEPSRALLIGGRPFGEEILMWWNFVARTRDEIDEAYRDWDAHSDRFGDVASDLARIPAPVPVWARPA